MRKRNGSDCKRSGVIAHFAAAIQSSRDMARRAAFCCMANLRHRDAIGGNERAPGWLEFSWADGGRCLCIVHEPAAVVMVRAASRPRNRSNAGGLVQREIGRQNLE